MISSCTPSPRFYSKAAKSNKIIKNHKPNRLGSKKRIINSNKKPQKPIQKKSEASNNYGYSDIIINESRKWLGTPYKYGGTSKNGIDCSSFVQNVMKEVGINLPRTAHQQFEFSYPLSLNNAEIGDLVFFRKASKVSHVGIYLGSNKFIHSSSSKGVILSSLDDSWYEENFYKVGRVKY